MRYFDSLVSSCYCCIARYFSNRIWWKQASRQTMALVNLIEHLISALRRFLQFYVERKNTHVKFFCLLVSDVRKTSATRIFSPKKLWINMSAWDIRSPFKMAQGSCVILVERSWEIRWVFPRNNLQIKNHIHQFYKKQMHSLKIWLLISKKNQGKQDKHFLRC